MLDFYADWWGACKKLDADTFSNNKVLDFSKENLISIKINTDSEEGANLSTEYNIHSLPTLVYINFLNEEVDRIIGYLPPEDYLKKLIHH